MTAFQERERLWRKNCWNWIETKMFSLCFFNLLPWVHQTKVPSAAKSGRLTPWSRDLGNYTQWNKVIRCDLFFCPSPLAGIKCFGDSCILLEGALILSLLSTGYLDINKHFLSLHTYLFSTTAKQKCLLAWGFLVFCSCLLNTSFSLAFPNPQRVSKLAHVTAH